MGRETKVGTERKPMREPARPAARRERRSPRPPRRHEPPLAWWLRILLFLVGWILVLVGIAGLVLPGLQGILTLLLGAAVLSVASELAYKLLRYSFRPWPRLWVRVARFRRGLRRHLLRWGGPRSGKTEPSRDPATSGARHPPADGDD